METLGRFKGIYRILSGLHWGYIGIMQKKMEAAGTIGVVLGLSCACRIAVSLSVPFLWQHGTP